MRACIVSSLVVAATALLLACGGGGSSDPTTPPATGKVVFALNVGGTEAGIFSEDTLDAVTNDSTLCPGGAPYTDSTLWTTQELDMSAIPTDAPPVEVFQSERYGPLTCTVPGLTPNKAYKVTLYNQESFVTAEGARLFGVKINGADVLNEFDLFKAAGGMYKAYAQTFDATADAEGKIGIALVASVQSPKLCGIKVTEAP